MLKKFKKCLSVALTTIILLSSLPSFSLSASADTVATDAQMAVIRKIIYAVETGGQVYGNVRYDDFTEAYANSSIEYAITIGGGQWYATEAKRLLDLIRSTDSATFSSLDTAGIGTDLDTKDWSTYQVSKTSAKALCIQKIISSPVGIKCQDQLLDDQMSTYMAEARELGITELDAQMMCANFRHQGGLGAVKRIIAKTEQPYTLDNLYAACQTDTGNQVGTYKTRQKMVYESLKKYLPVAGITLDTSNPVDLGTDFYAHISFSDKNFSLNGDNVILFTPSTSDAQVWRFIRQSDGSYNIANRKKDKYLAVEGASGYDGANVRIETYDGSDGQRWFIYESDGKYLIKSACSESCVIDVTNGATADYTNIRQNTYNGTSEQKLTINKMSESTTIPTTEAISYFPACDSSYATLSAALTSIGVDNSKAYRTIIAEANGIADYTGTAEQNTQMLNLLKAGKLIKPADTEATEATEVTEVTEITEATEVTETTEATEVTEATEATETTEAGSYLLGDVDLDGDINVLDATLIQKIIAGLIESTNETNALADVNADNSVDIMDATQIQMYCAGLIDGFTGSGDSENTEPTTEEPATEEPTTEEPTTEEPTTEEPTTEPTTSAVKYFPACSSSQTTLAAALTSVGAESSYAYRTTIAAANGITDYSGTAEQNTQMLNLLKQGKLIVP